MVEKLRKIFNRNYPFNKKANKLLSSEQIVEIFPQYEKLFLPLPPYYNDIENDQIILKNTGIKISNAQLAEYDKIRMEIYNTVNYHLILR